MKNSIKMFVLFAGIWIASVPAKAQTWQWANRAGGTANAYSGGVDVDVDGNSYVTGKFFDSISFGTVTLSNPGLWSVFIAKFDANGNLSWAKTVARDSAISVSGICRDVSGNILITGQFSGTGLFGTINPVPLVSSGDFDVFVARYDATGELTWVQSSGGPGVDYAGGISTDHFGNVYVTGDFHMTSFPASAAKIFLAKYDSTGNCAWLRIPQAYGNFHYGMGIKTEANGNSYITGQFFNVLIFDSSYVLNAGNIEANIFIAKFNADGNIVWMQKAGAPSGYTGANAIDVDLSGNAYITGYYRGNISFGTLNLSGPSGLTYDVFIAKCDPNGNFVWVNKADGPGTLDEARGITTDNSGSCYVTGYFAVSLTFGSTTLTNTGGRDLFLAKANPSGNFVWATQCGGPSPSGFGGVKVHSQDIYLTGNFADTIFFDTSLSLTAPGSNNDFFLAKLNLVTNVPAGQNPSAGYILFPNPVTNEIELKGMNRTEKYMVFNLLGEKMSEGITSETNKISVADLKNGMYFIQLPGSSDSEKTRQLKFIKN